ncbi:MAG: fructose PTS transporter subunit IIA [Planctomycetota bacterium]
MRLTEILKPQSIVAPLQATDKTAAITELVNLLASNGEITDSEKVLSAILERESTRTTGIGNGLAIPHGKTHGVKQLVIAIGRPAQGIDFASIDGKPVNLIWLLASPPDKTGPHITALGKISRLMIIDTFRTKLQTAENASAMYDLIVKQEESM